MFNAWMKKGPTKLLVTSRGFSGTIFLLSFLTSLNECLVGWRCSHNAKFFPNGITVFGQNESSECYITNEEETKHLPLADIFYRMSQKQNAKSLYCIGHWLDLHDVTTKYGEAYLKQNKIKLINLIRHPIDRTHSNWLALKMAFAQGIPEDHKKGFAGTIDNHRDWLEDFIKVHHISLHNENDITFIGACLNLFACALDASYQKYLHINIESLNNVNLARLIHRISHGQIKLTPHDVTKIHALKNSHFARFHEKSFNAKPDETDILTTYQKFSSWLPWQQDLYRTCMVKSTLYQSYKKFKFDLCLK